MTNGESAGREIDIGLTASPGLDRPDVDVIEFDTSIAENWKPALPVVADHDLDDELVTRLLYAHEERGSTDVEILEHALRIALRRPTRTTLERMRAVANDVGRRDSGGDAIAKVLTQDVVDQLFERNADR